MLYYDEALNTSFFKSTREKVPWGIQDIKMNHMKDGLETLYLNFHSKGIYKAISANHEHYIWTTILEIIFTQLSENNISRQ